MHYARLRISGNLSESIEAQDITRILVVNSPKDIKLEVGLPKIISNNYATPVASLKSLLVVPFINIFKHNKNLGSRYLLNPKLRQEGDRYILSILVKPGIQGKTLTKTISNLLANYCPFGHHDW